MSNVLVNVSRHSRQKMTKYSKPKTKQKTPKLPSL